MDRRVRRRPVLVLPLVLVGAAGAIGYAVVAARESATPSADGTQTGTGTVVGGNGPQSPSPTRGPGNAQGPSGEFFISGRVDGLVPGQPGTLPLTVTNPNPWPIQVRTLDTAVGAAGPRCPADTLAVGSYTYRGGPVLSAPARGTVVVTVPVELADSPTQDQSGCPGSSFPLTFTGTAVKATR